VVESQSLTDLVVGAQAGKDDAWNELVGRLANLVWSVTRSFRIPHYDALDIAQTTWLNLARKLHTIEDPERIGLWLVTTTRRECLNYARRAHVRSRVESFELFDARPTPNIGPDEALIAREEQRQLWHALIQLPDGCQALLRMFLSDPEPSYAEVAAALDMPINSVGPRRNRCLQKLRHSILSNNPSIHRNPAPGGPCS
jgi:RNA polymerase sigma factor (sigma-70 family)